MCIVKYFSPPSPLAALGSLLMEKTGVVGREKQAKIRYNIDR
jgi:hypothetical protein